MSASIYKSVVDASAFGRVAVLLGGTSNEREISLLSGQAVYSALLEKGVDAHLLDARGGYIDVLARREFDRVWIALHGRGGEDGTVQGLLESLEIPYTGSGVLGSAVSMDKMLCKQLFDGAGLPTPKWLALDTVEDCFRVVEELGLPVCLKPASDGSSIGISKVEQEADLPGAWHKAAAIDPVVIAESWVNGAEYTAAILHDQVLPVIRIDVASGFYDYEAKYSSDETRYQCPSDLSAVAEERMAELARQVFRIAGATGWGRVDFMVDDQGNPLILEINTVPGMTSHSLVPMAAAAAGVSFADLVWKILETSMPLEQEAENAA